MLDKDIQEACRMWPGGVRDMARMLKDFDLAECELRRDDALLAETVAAFDLGGFCSVYVDSVARPIRLVVQAVEKQLKTIAINVKSLKVELTAKKPSLSAVAARRCELQRTLRPLVTLLHLFGGSPSTTTDEDDTDADLTVLAQRGRSNSLSSISAEAPEPATATATATAADGPLQHSLSFGSRSRPGSSLGSTSPPTSPPPRTARRLIDSGHSSTSKLLSQMTLPASPPVPPLSSGSPSTSTPSPSPSPSSSHSPLSSQPLISSQSSISVSPSPVPSSPSLSSSSSSLSSSSSSSSSASPSTDVESAKKSDRKKFWVSLRSFGSGPSKSADAAAAAAAAAVAKKQAREVHVIKELSTMGGSGCSVFAVSVEGWMSALKQIDLAFLTPSFKSEIKILESLPMHENIVRYLGHDYTERECRLFIELWDGTLGELLAEKRNTDDFFPRATIIKVALHVATGLQFLHQHHIVHRDLKADNIFVRTKKRQILSAAIGDFDTAKDVFESQAKTVVGSPSIIAPEVLAGRNKISYTDKCDVYSFGILLFELTTLRSPWAGTPMLQIANLILKGDLPQAPPQLPTEYEPFAVLWKACLRLDPATRPTIAEILQFLARLEQIIRNS